MSLVTETPQAQLSVELRVDPQKRADSLILDESRVDSKIDAAYRRR